MPELQNPSAECTGSGGPQLWEINLGDLFHLAIVVVLGLSVWWLRSIAQPVLLALLLAYLINPVIVWCQGKWNWTRLRCVMVIFLFALTVVLGLFVVVLPLASVRLAT